MANYTSLQGFCNNLNDYCNQDDPTELNPWQDIILRSTVRGCQLSAECVEAGDGGWVAFDKVQGRVFFAPHLNEWCVTADAEDFSHENEI